MDKQEKAQIWDAKTIEVIGEMTKAEILSVPGVMSLIIEDQAVHNDIYNRYENELAEIKEQDDDRRDIQAHC